MKRLYKRTIYLFYYISKLDRKKFIHFLSYAASRTGRSKPAILVDAVRSVYAYNVSLLEYFQFRFYNKDKQERSLWAGTGYMYEYQLVMNPRAERKILDDKRLFSRNYKAFIHHLVASLQELEEDPALVEAMLGNPSGKIVLKVFDGKCGKQVLIQENKEFRDRDLIAFMKTHGYDLVEEFIEQHPALQQLSPSAVNTVRIFTQLDSEDEVVFLGCRLRISVNRPVDNLAAGNIAAPIDTETGVITGPAVYGDIDKASEVVHPVTGVKIPGFQIPFWKETIEMIRAAAKLHPQNRSIGWDVAITPDGADLIEGNHDWCKLVYQLPLGVGLKQSLETYVPV